VFLALRLHVSGFPVILSCMVWHSNDDMHEGYLAARFADGAVSLAEGARGPLVSRHDANGQVEYEQRSYDDVIGWQLRCDCSREGTSRVSTWEGPMYERVPIPSMEDVASGRIYVPVGELSTYPDEREDVETIVRGRWLSEHVMPLEVLEAVRAARADVAAAGAALDAAVVRARAVGTSWAKIGDATGMTRQSAQERWGSVSGPGATTSTP
jgi:hypothetical protein